jgi:hypothetical protein
MGTNPVILSAILAIAALPSRAGTQAPPSDQEIANKITEASLQAKAILKQYSVIRTYKLHNSRLSRDAAMTVRLNYRKGEGDSFEVLKIENGTGMGRTVLNKVIESEATASKKDDQLDITKTNYKFHVTGTGMLNGRRCFIVDLIPNKRSKYLLQGTAWVDPTEFAILRVGGRPSANLSFAVGKPYIVIDFQKIGPFWMAVRNRSESESFLLGSSILTIDFSSYEFRSDVRLAGTRGSPSKQANLE